jgi:hypothetical protein
MKENSLYRYLYKAITNSTGMLIFTFLIALPVINLWVFSCMVFCYCFVDWQLLTHTKNQRRVEDPFLGLYREDQLCETLDKKYVTLKLLIRCNVCEI